MAWEYGVDYELPHCPVCGRECHTIYEDKNGHILGCNHDIEAKDANDYFEEEQ
jgi:hypothetical protein